MKKHFIEDKNFKVCSWCNKTKPLNEFDTYKNKYGEILHRSPCKECRRKNDNDSYRSKHPSKKSIIKEGYKICTKCKLEKTTDNFSKRGNGFISRCKSCVREIYRLKYPKKEMPITKDGYKICSHCSEEKIKADFVFDKRKQGYGTCCKSCLNKISIESYHRNHPDSKYKKDKHIAKEGYKICPKCKLEKLENEFCKCSSNVDGLNIHCKQCGSEYGKKYYNKNKEGLKIKRHEYYLKNKEKETKRNTAYYDSHKKQYKDYSKEWHLKNKKRRNKDSHDNYINNKDSYRERDRKWKQEKRINDSIYKLNSNMSLSIAHDLKGKKDRFHWESLAQYTLIDLKKNIESKWTEGMSWDNYGKQKDGTWGWEIDHIIPKSKWNITSNNCEDFKKCWALENLQPLWKLTKVINGVEYLGNCNKQNKIIKETKRDVA